MPRRAVLILTAAAVAALASSCADEPATPAAAHPPVIVVAPNGSATGSGTPAHPLAAIQSAIDRVSAHGGTVELRGGIYHQRIHLIGAHDVTVMPYHHEHAQLSGAGLTPPAGISALVEIADSTNVSVRSLDLTAYRTVRKRVTPAGIYVHGHDDGVLLTANHVHDLGTENNTLGSFAENAHGIAVYGDDPHGPVRGLRIDGNEVDDLHLGASESVVVNGNVDGWAITDNSIHDDDNIGIDAIGFEPTLPPAYRYTTANRARNGVITGNHVARIRSRGNPAYWEDGEWCNCADGIYVDGGTHIRIAGNTVTDDDIGIEVAAENAHGDADHVDVDRNLVTGSVYVGITTGGYCDGHSDCGGVETGSAHDNSFTDNTLRGNNRLDDGSPELLVQYHTWGTVFEHNTIEATSSSHSVYGTVPRYRVTPGRPPNHSDHNHFAAFGATAGQLRFGWAGHNYVGFGTYRAATGQDAHSTAG